jgi:DNA-binding MarR family transcriptional regulator
MQVLVDGVDAEICPLPFAEEAVGRIVSLERVRALTQEQMEVLAIVASLGSATRRQVERLRGEDCESLLRRLAQRGLVEPVPDEARPGAPNIYRLTTRGVAACGHSSLEGLQAELLGAMEAEEAGRLAALSRETRATGARAPHSGPAAGLDQALPVTQGVDGGARHRHVPGTAAAGLMAPPRPAPAGAGAGGAARRG